MDRRFRFGLTVLILWFAAFVIGAVATPPDVVTQVLVVGGMLVLTVPLAYLVVYRFGGELDGGPDDEWDDDWEGP
jgi:hypothetical protein